MKLSPRRFPHTIIRRRQEPESRNVFGESEPGVVTETIFRASVQPLGLEDADLVGGVKLINRLKAIIPIEGALVAAFDDREADRVVVDGDEYVVEESRSWSGSHTRATLLRET